MHSCKTYVDRHLSHSPSPPSLTLDMRHPHTWGRVGCIHGAVFASPRHTSRDTAQPSPTDPNSRTLKAKTKVSTTWQRKSVCASAHVYVVSLSCYRLLLILFGCVSENLQQRIEVTDFLL